MTTASLGDNHLPNVDVVVPVYNGATHLQETLETIERQTYPNIHTYIVDDHSTDSTPAILASHQSRFPLTIIRHEKNRGLSAARNTGIASGQGAYIAILDADDLWSPNKIERQIATFQSSDNNSLGIVSSDFQIIDENGEMKDETVYDYCCDFTPATRNRLVMGNLVSGGSAALIRRECFDRCGGFDETLTACEDWEMWHRIAGQYSIKIHREPLVLVRRHSQSMQGDTPRMLRNRIEVFRRFASDRSCHRLAEMYLVRECLSAFRYLPENVVSSYEEAMEQLRTLSIDTGDLPEHVWRRAYRRQRLTSTLFSIRSRFDNKFQIRQRVRKQRVLSRLYRGMRWRVQALFKPSDS